MRAGSLSTLLVQAAQCPVSPGPAWPLPQPEWTRPRPGLGALGDSSGLSAPRDAVATMATAQPVSPFAGLSQNQRDVVLLLPPRKHKTSRPAPWPHTPCCHPSSCSQDMLPALSSHKLLLSGSSAEHLSAGAQWPVPGLLLTTAACSRPLPTSSVLRSEAQTCPICPHSWAAAQAPEYEAFWDQFPNATGCAWAPAPGQAAA